MPVATLITTRRPLQMNTHIIRLEWEQKQCPRCSGVRILGQACPDCGLGPRDHEFNRPLQLRVRAAKPAIEALRKPPGGVDRVDPLALSGSDYWSSIAEWLNEFLKACAGLATGHQGSALRLVEEVEKFAVLREQTSQLEPLRPYIPRHRAAVEIVSHLENMVAAYLDGLVAPTPLAAQRASLNAQTSLDLATAAMPNLSVRLGDDFEAAEDVGELLGSLLRAASTDDAGQTGALALLAKGERQLSDLLQATTNGESGLRYLLLRPMVSAYMGAERFDSTLRSTFNLLLANREAFLALALDETFRRDFQRARMGFFDATQQTWTVLRSASLVRQAVRTLIELASEFVEGCGATVCACLLISSGVKTRPYVRLRHDDATDLLRSARAQPAMNLLLSGLDPDLRNAAAHRGYELEEDGTITLDLRSARGRTVAPHNFINGLFEGMESVLAMLIGMEAAMEAVGAPSMQGTLADLGIGPAASAALAVELILGIRARGDEERGLLRIVLESEPTGKLSPAVAAAITQIPPSITSFRIEVEGDGGGHHTFEGPVSAYTRYERLEAGLEKEIAFVHTQRLWTYDGEPAMPDAALKKWVAAKAVEVIGRGFPEAVLPLRQLRALSATVGDVETTSMLTCVIRDLRMKAVGPSDVSTDYLARLRDWAAADASWSPP